MLSDTRKKDRYDSGADLDDLEGPGGFGKIQFRDTCIVIIFASNTNSFEIIKYILKKKTSLDMLYMYFLNQKQFSGSYIINNI